MKNIIKKSLSLFLAALMLVSCFAGFSVEAFAAEKSKTVDSIKYYYIIKNDKAIITYASPTKKVSTMKIPSTLSGKPVTTLGEYSLVDWEYESVKTVTIPDSVTTIKHDAFCVYSMTTLNLGKGVKTLEDDVFGRAEKLTKITVNKDNKYFTTIEGNLYSKDKTKLVKYASGKSAKTFTVPSNVKYLGYGAFSSALHLTKIVLPNNITKIPNDAFVFCSNLTTVSNTSKVTKIGTNAFSYTAIKSIRVPKTVTNIGYGAFAQCENLTSVDMSEASIKTIPKEVCEGSIVSTFKFPKGVTKIDDFALAFTKLKTAEIPKTVTKMGNYVFCGSTITSADLSNIKLSTLPRGTFSSCEKIATVKFPKGMTKVGDNAFSWSGIKAITIPSTVTVIGYDAFYGSKIQSIVIPSSVTKICGYAFENCRYLTSATIKNPETTIYSYAFEARADFVMKGKKGSTAQKYADKYGIEFKAI